MSALKKTTGTITILLVVTIATIFVVSRQREQTGKLSDVDLVLNWLANGSHAAYFVAKEREYYKAEGLQVNILEGSGSGTTVKVVGSGTHMFGIASGESVAIGRSVGIPVVALAVFYQRSPVCLFSLEKADVQRPEDLVGKRMGVKFGSSTYPMYKAMLKKYGIGDSEIREVSIGKGVEPLLAGDVDAMNGHIDNEPIQVGAQGYPVNVISYDSLGIKAYGIALITSDKYVSEEPELVSGFLRATLKGWDYVIDHPREAASSVVRSKPSLRADIVGEQTKRCLPLLVSQDTLKYGLGWQNKGGWQETVSSLKEMGQIPKNVRVEGIYTMRFWDTSVSVDVGRVQMGESEPS